MSLTRRRFLTSLAALAGLSVVPRHLLGLGKLPPTVVGDRVYPVRGFTVFPTAECDENGRMLSIGNRRITYVDGSPRMGIIDKDHVPEGTKLEEWRVVIPSGYAAGMVCHSPYGWTDLNDRGFSFAYTGPHLIYSRLFPIPS